MLGLLSSAAKFSIACFHKSEDLLTTYDISYDDDDDDNDDDDDDDDEYESVGGHPRGGSRVLMFEKPDTAVVLSWHSALDTVVLPWIVSSTGYCSHVPARLYPV